MSQLTETGGSRPERRREDGARSSRRRTRRHSEERSRSRSRRRRHRGLPRDPRSRSRSRSLQRQQHQRKERERAEREERERAEREERERAQREREPSNTILVHGIPDAEVTEERLEAVAWETAVQAGCSMPNGVHFAYDRSTRKFRGFALVEFPHKEAAKTFKEHTSGLLEVDGFNLALKYHHTNQEPSRSRSRDRGGAFNERDEPSVTLIIKGISSSTPEAALANTFQPYATIKDIRHFPRRGFAFVQFHTIEDAVLALNRFERDCRSRLDGERVVAHFAKEREDGRYSGAERSFLQKQALVTAEATAELEKLAAQQVQQENTTKALSGVNAEMWASYMQSVAQTETVQSSNSFEYDKDSGYYLDPKAGLYYDPNTTYFFTTDYKKYFVYDHEEEKLCLVDSEGKKVPGGERRPLPSQADKSRSREQPRERDREQPRERGPPPERDLQHERPRSRSRRRDRSGSPTRNRERDRGGRAEHDRCERDRGDRTHRDRDNRDRERDRIRDRDHHDLDKDREPRRREPELPTSPLVEVKDGKPKPIHFPGGDPLAKLAPAPDPAAQKAPQPKKRRKPPEGVLGLVPMPESKAPGVVPGPVVVLSSTAPKPGPVTVFAPLPLTRQLGCGGGAAAVQVGTVDRGSGGDIHAAAAAAIAAFAATPSPQIPTSRPPALGGLAGAGLASKVGAAATGEWICEICMRKFGSEENLRRHEQMSDLHKENMAKLNAAI